MSRTGPIAAPLLLALAAALAAAPLAAQSASSSAALDPARRDWVKIDGPQIDRASWAAIGAMLGSDAPGLRDQALDSIEQSIRDGGTGPQDPNVVGLLSSLCLTSATRYAPGAPPQPDYPLLRIRALRLAALLGGDDSHALFMAVLRTEAEPAVLAQAHEGLRRLQRKPDQAELSLIARHLRLKPNGLAPNALAIELMADIRAYHEHYAVMARQDIFDGLLAVYQDSDYLRSVRSQAKDLMKTLLGL